MSPTTGTWRRASPEAVRPVVAGSVSIALPRHADRVTGAAPTRPVGTAPVMAEPGSPGAAHLPRCATNFTWRIALLVGAAALERHPRVTVDHRHHPDPRRNPQP
ncbi:hypothetical protein AQJ46_47520 [Streptomyces canus]|uniref:Uncharacterized protein n=1 Tax=Streptomyces canus TaxID=58343 RepID=A0A101RKQ2_9ACTN|nr:hypothetical protein AQJ46_47520 [Streptomyces canus]